MPKINATPYTQAEAKEFVGKVFESQTPASAITAGADVEFSGVPKGTKGKVVAIDKMGDGYDLVTPALA
jgi:hypothetical protein